MGTIAVGYDNFGVDWIQVIAGGQIDYNVIQQSIGQGTQYGLNGLYMKTKTISQLLQTVTLEKNNRRGIFEQKQFVPTIDPYQLVSAITADVVDHKENESLTFNGLQNFVVPIETDEQVFFVFSLEEQGVSKLMIDTPDNFERLEYYDFLADFPDAEVPTKSTQKEILVQLRVINNSTILGDPFTGKVSLLGGAPDTYNQSANAQGLWSWATANTEPFNVSAINLQYKNAGAPTFLNQTVYGSFNTAQSWANALNTQTGLGLFWVTYNILNQPILMTTNDTLDFGTLTYTGTL